MSKDFVQGHSRSGLQSSLTHAELLGMLKCFYTGEEPLRDAKWDGAWVSLGIPSASCIPIKSAVGQTGSSKVP